MHGIQIAVTAPIWISSAVSNTYNNATNIRTNYTREDIRPVIDHNDTIDMDTVVIKQGNYTTVNLNKSLTCNGMVMEPDRLYLQYIYVWKRFTPDRTEHKKYMEFNRCSMDNTK